jgi:transcriptional regulator with XRE-family HTH domain
MQELQIPSRVADGDFGGWLREALAARRVSQRVLAMRSGVNHSTISRILAGRNPSLATALAILRVLGPSEASQSSERPGAAGTGRAA